MRVDSRLFIEGRRELLEALQDARETATSPVRPSPEEIDVLLDLSALYLSQRMLPEARSFLAGVPDATGSASDGQADITASQAGRRAALDAALTGFDGAATPAPAGWADAPLFDALHHIARSEHAEARPFLASAKAILDGYPPALGDPAALQLLWSAIESDTWNTARSLAARMERETETRQSAGYRYLLGRASEVGGDRVAAFDNYSSAAAGSDEWAQHARLALIDLAQATATMPPEDARRLLMQTRALWSGGALALATLQRLAELETAEQRLLPALEVLGEIAWRHPGTPEAERALGQADALIGAVYTRGLAGEMPLADLLAAHRAIERDYGASAVFDAFAEPLADYLAASGASGLAAAEYGAIRARVSTRISQLMTDPLRDREVIATLHQTRDRLRLKHAAALMQGGRLAEAGTLLLDPAFAAPDSPLSDQYNLMRAQFFAATQRPADVLETRMAAPSEEYLRLRGEAAFELRDWAQAQSAYEALLLRADPPMEPRDRINLLLAAHRGGDPDRVRDLIQSFGDPDDPWTALAARLTNDTPDVLPLRDFAAWQRIENAGVALRQLQGAGGGGLP